MMKGRRGVDTWAIALNEDNGQNDPNRRWGCGRTFDNEDGWGERWQYYRAGHQVHTMGGWEVRFTILINLYSKLIITILLIISIIFTVQTHHHRYHHHHHHRDLCSQWSHRMAVWESPAGEGRVLHWCISPPKSLQRSPRSLSKMRFATSCRFVIPRGFKAAIVSCSMYDPDKKFVVIVLVSFEAPAVHFFHEYFP